MNLIWNRGRLSSRFRMNIVDACWISFQSWGLEIKKNLYFWIWVTKVRCSTELIAHLYVIWIVGLQKRNRLFSNTALLDVCQISFQSLDSKRFQFKKLLFKKHWYFKFYRIESYKSMLHSNARIIEIRCFFVLWRAKKFMNYSSMAMVSFLSCWTHVDACWISFQSWGLIIEKISHFHDHLLYIRLHR